MSISAGLNWTGDLATGAATAAAEVDRLIGTLRALQSVSGGKGTLPGLGGAGGGQSFAASTKEANKAALIQLKSAADLAKVDAQRKASVETVGARQAAVAAKGAADMQRIQAQQAAAQSASEARINEARVRASLQAAAIEQEGAAKANEIREKAAADIARIQAKAAADAAKTQAKEAAKAAKAAAKEPAAFDPSKLKLPPGARLAMSGPLGFRLPKGARVAGMAASPGPGPMPFAEATTSGFGGAMKALLEGKGAKGAVGAFGGKLATVAAIGSEVVDVLASVGSVLAGLSKSFLFAAVDAQAYKEDVSEAFTVVAKDAKAGQAVMVSAMKAADRLGSSRAETAGQYLDLLTKGFDVKTIDRIVASLSDLSTIDPKASMEGLTKVIGKAQATGRLNIDILSELSTFGLEQGDVIREIGKMLNKTDAEVLKALSSAGGIRGIGVEPILRAINAQVGGGEAGAKAAEKANRNLSSLIKRTKELPENILFDISAGPGIDNIKRILKDVLGYFATGSETAKRASDVIGKAFNALVEGLAGTSLTDKEGITKTLDTIVLMIEAATPVIRAFGAAFRWAGFAVGAAIGGWGVILSGELFSGIGSDIASFASSIGTWFSDIGTNIIDGITGGISGGAQRVIDAVTSVASGALKSAKSVLGIASPSKEFYAVGSWSAEGMARAFEREAPLVSNAARMMADDARLAASLQVPTLTSGRVTATSGSMGAGAATWQVIEVRLPPGPLVGVQAGAGTDARALAETLDPIIRQKLVEIFAQIRLEGLLS